MMIEHIEFADGWALARRLLTTPRYSPWVVLHAVSDAPLVPRPAKPFVVVLPLELKDEAAAEAALDAALAPSGEISAWLKQLRPAVRLAIEAKEVLRGMRRTEVFASLGTPVHWVVDRIGEQPVQVAWYGDQEIWLQQDLVVDIRPPRALR